MSATQSSTALPAVEAPPKTGPVAALRRLDWWLVGAVVLLLGYGVLMIMSASSLHADARYGDPLHFITRQGMGIGMGLALTVGILLTPFAWVRRSASSSPSPNTMSRASG